MQTIRLTPPTKSDSPESSPERVDEWIDLDITDAADVRWLNSQSGLDDEHLRRLLDAGRFTYWRQFDQATYINLRLAKIGQLTSEDSVIELGFWLEPGRIITVRRGKVLALEKAAAVCRKGHGPSTSWELFTLMLSALGDRLEESLHVLASVIDGVEEQILTEGSHLPIDQMAQLRKRLIYARRYKIPLTDLINFISSRPSLGMESAARVELPDIADAIAQHEQLLGSLIDRAAALQDQIQNQLVESMNTVMYRFTWVATVFLPLGFVTGLLGINVAGIPGTHDPFAFWLVCFLLVGIGVAWAILVARFTKLSQERGQSRKT